MQKVSQKFPIGCHVSVAGGVWNAPKNAASLGCETSQIFTRPPMGGAAPVLDEGAVEKFKEAIAKYFPSSPSPSPRPSPSRGEVEKDGEFVVHCPYFINFGSSSKRIYHGSISVVRQELERASLLGAKFVMTHLGSFKDLGQAKGMKQVQEGLKEVLENYKGSTEFLLEISAGAGEVIGDTFEELAEIMEPIKKHEGFGGICFDTQHAFASGYDVRAESWINEFNKTIGLKYLRMSHINDSKIPLAGRKDRHEHIGDGEIGKEGIGEFMGEIQHHFDSAVNLSARPKGGSLLSLKGETNKVLRNKTLSPPRQARGTLPPGGESNNVAFGSFPLILETEHDKVEKDIKILKQLRDKFKK